jgi:HNH endonuclease
MRRAFKDPASIILAEGLQYIISNSANNKKIAEILLVEQKNYCAYTDEYITRTDAKDIEHFNPTLKGTDADSYDNWFMVKHQWNKEKSDKWEKFQPILHPTAEDFEERVVYSKGDYIAKWSEDIEANNLVKLLQLDDAILAENRKKYIDRKKKEIALFQQDAATYFTTLIDDNSCSVLYPRAIKEEFEVDILSMIL